MDGLDHPAPPTLRTAPRARTLQTIPLTRAPALRPLYWRPLNPNAPTPEATALHFPQGAHVAFDTYFGAFFEHHWRRLTTLETLTLRLSLQGHARIRIWRRPPHGPATLQLETTLDSDADLPLPPLHPHFRQPGLTWFDIATPDAPATLHAASWTTPDSLPAPISPPTPISPPAPTFTAPGSATLGIAICTFGREDALAALLHSIAGHAPLQPALSRIVVVNQGPPTLRTHPGIAAAATRLGPRLRFLHQPNLGGAGGFGRAILAHLDDPETTHICLLDDDVALEPDCLLRMAAAFALARDPRPIGGHMLDSLQPHLLYEAGARIRPDLTLQPLHHMHDLRPHPEPGEALAPLLDIPPVHYNGWWMFGLPKHLIHEHGMPLPCFIRGDDVEFGLRLHQRGIPTTPFPGIAVWHDPFYLKLGSWQLYYEVRNAILCAFLHQRTAARPRALVATLARRLLHELLTYRYYNAALTIRAIRHASDGPAFLEADPRPLHAALQSLRTAHHQAWTARTTVLPGQPPSNRSRLPTPLRLARALLRNTLLPPDPHAPPLTLEAHHLHWTTAADADTLVLETYWDDRLPTFHRDPASFRSLAAEAARALLTLWRRAPRLETEIAETAARVTTVPAWRRYVARWS